MLMRTELSELSHRNETNDETKAIKERSWAKQRNVKPLLMLETPVMFFS